MTRRLSDQTVLRSRHRRLFLEGLEPRQMLTGSAEISGAVWDDLNANAVRDAGEPPLADVVVYLDQNNNGQRDLSALIEPDQYVTGTVLNTIHPGVTLSVLSSSNTPFPFPVTATADSFNFAPTGRLVFAHANVQFFNNDRRLKMAFAAPVGHVSIDFAGGNTVTTEFGRLEAYDAGGNLLATYVTQPRSGGAKEMMTIVRPQADISFAIAYTPLGGGSFGRLDNLRFGNEAEPAEVTAADGTYSFTELAAGSYVVREQVPAAYRQTFPQITADRLFLADLNSTPNRIVEINAATGAVINAFNAPINASAFSSGMAFDGQVLYYIEDTPSNDTLFRVNPNTGQTLGSRVLPPGTYDGLAAVGGLIYAKLAGSNQLAVYNPATDQLTPSITITGLTSPLRDGLGELVATSSILARNNFNQLVSINPATGAATTLFGLSTAGDIRGITSVGREFYIGTTSGLIDVYDRNAQLKVRTLAGLPGVYALGGAKGFDGGHRVTLASGQAVTNIDFSNESIAIEIHGAKWNDLDGDGLRDTGEPAMAGVAVYLDLNDNGSRDPSEPFTTTGIDGSFAFTGLAPGDYVVREEAPANYHQTSPRVTPPRMFAVDLSAGPPQILELEPATGRYLGSIPSPAPFTNPSTGIAFDGQTLFFLADGGVDTLYELDPNTGAVLDSTVLPSRSYTGLASVGRYVYVLDTFQDDILRFDPVTDTVTSTYDLNSLNAGLPINDGLGEYRFTGELIATTGNAIIFFDSNTGVRTHSFPLPSAVFARGITSIGQEIFIGLPGRIEVYNRSGALLRTIAIGTSVVALGGGAGDGAHRLHLGPSQDAVGVDFGNRYSLGEIRGVKWLDADGDGVPDAGESPIANVIVYADLNENGQLDEEEPSAVTGNDGAYVLAGLPAGEYIVREVPRAFYEQTFPRYDVREYVSWSYLIQGSGQMTLARIDPDSGVVTRIGNRTGFAIHGLVQTNSGELFGINGFAPENDGFYSINPATGVATLIGSTGLDLAFGLAYDAETDAIYGLGVAPQSSTINLVQFDRTTGQATIIGPGVASSQLTGTSGIAFDPNRRVIMALDNFDDQFWEFDLSGNATLIWDTENLDGFGLAHNGKQFVHWPRGVGGNNLLREVDPHNQTFGSTFAAQRFIGMEALDARLVKDAHRVLLAAGETAVGIDFGNLKLNEPPVASAGGPYTVNEGGAVTLDASGSSDPDQSAATLTYTWDLDGDSIFGETGAEAGNGDEVGASPIFSAGQLDDSTVVVTLRVTDDGGLYDEATATITVLNVAPTIDSIGSSATFNNPAAKGANVQISGLFSDAGLLDTHSAVIDWGDGTIESGTVQQSAGGGSYAGEHAYAAGGIYTVSVTITDDDAGAATTSTLAVIVGAGVHDGVLQIIGTSASDTLSINRQGDGSYVLHASFLSDSPRTIDGDVNSIRVWLGDGDDTAHLAGNISTPAILEGGAGNDRLDSASGPAILLGGEGNDELKGGQGRSILIGGLGADWLIGGPGENILISGWTVYDQSDEALLSLLEEWNSARSYDVRVRNLRTGSGPVLQGTGRRLVLDQTIFNDGERDVLIGAAGLDWFLFGEEEDEARDMKSSESEG